MDRRRACGCCSPRLADRPSCRSGSASETANVQSACKIVKTELTIVTPSSGNSIGDLRTYAYVVP
jgi:hypothetical protein